MTRAYLRLDPGFYERKVIRQGYPLPVAMTLVGVYCLAESQPDRGRFRDLRLLKALLGDAGKHLAFLVDRGDVVQLADGRVYPEGWDEWQEGDWKVGERVKRIRERTKLESVADVTPATVTKRTKSTVYTPSEAGHSGAGHSKNLSTKRSPRDDRADIVAFTERYGEISDAQRRVLDEILERHDVNGPQWAAGLMRAARADEDPLDVVMRADRTWQNERRRQADAEERDWARRKADERAAAEAVP